MLSCVQELNEHGNLRGWGQVVIIIIIIIIIIAVVVVIIIIVIITIIIIRRTQSQYMRLVFLCLRYLLSKQPIDFQAIP